MKWLTSYNRYTTIGVIYVLSFSIINAIKSVLEGSLLVNISPEFLMFNTLLLAQTYYIIFHKAKGDLWNKIKQNWKLVIMHNITTMVSWLAVFYALIALSPAVANSLIVGLGPLVTLMLLSLLQRRKPKNAHEIFSAIGCLVSVLYLVYVSLEGRSALSHTESWVVLEGVTACLLTAIGVSANIIVTKALSEKKFSSADMMTSRFTLINIVCFCMIYYTHSWTSYSLQLIFIMVGLTIIGILIAIYFLQIGISRIQPTTVSFLCTTGLIFTYLFQFFDPRLTNSPYSLLGIFALAGFMLYGTIGKNLKIRMKKTLCDESQ